ncbi:DUF4432 family protein [Actinomycetes bacterium KLBMP 9797]
MSLRGVPAVVLENELLRVTVLLHGGHVVEFNHKPRDLDYVWLRPGASWPDGRGNFFDSYPGGWQEIVPNGGAPATYRGAVLDQHGEATALPWECEVVEDAPARVVVRLTVHARRTPLRVSKVLTLAAGSARLAVSSTVANLAPVEVHAMWGQHLAFGAPFLVPGSRLTLPPGVTVRPHENSINPPRRAVAPGGPYPWPSVPTPDGASVDLSVLPPPGAPSDIVYLTGFTDGWYELRRPDDKAGVRVEWDAATLPYLWLWQECGDTTDFPWWGQAYVVGVEPFSSYPTNGLPEAVANGSALTLPPESARDVNWSVEVLA